MPVRRYVAAGPHLITLRANPGGGSRYHLQWRLSSESSNPRSRNGLKVIIGMPRFAQGCNSWSMRGLLEPTFLTEEQDAVGMAEIIQRDGTDRRAEALL
jgi:hypothetical protein